MKLWKQLSMIAILVLAAIGIAQEPDHMRGVGAVGRGLAANQDGVRAEFNFEAIKKLVEGQELVRGRLDLTVLPGDNRPGVKIQMVEARMLAVNGNVCEFAGPGKMIIRTPKGPQEVMGRVVVRVVDNRPPIGEGEQVQPGDNLDLIHVRFERPNSNEGFQYGGKVVRGDIKVHRLHPPTQ